MKKYILISIIPFFTSCAGYPITISLGYDKATASITYHGNQGKQPVQAQK